MAFFIQSNLNLEIIAPHKKTTVVQFKRESGLNVPTVYNTIQKDVIQENTPSFMNLNEPLIMNVDRSNIELKQPMFAELKQDTLTNGLCELGGLVSTSEPISTSVDSSRKVILQEFGTLSSTILPYYSLSTLHIYVPYSTAQIQDILSKAKRTSYAPLVINVKRNISTYFFREYSTSLAYESKTIVPSTKRDPLMINVKKNTQAVFLYENSFSAADENINDMTEKEYDALVVDINGQEMIEEQRTVFNDLVMYVDTIVEDDNTAKTFAPLDIVVEGSTSSSVGDSTGLETLNIEMQKNVFCRYTYKFTDTYIASISGLPSGMSYNQQSIFGSVKVAGTYSCVMSLQNGNDIGLTIRISEITRLQ